MKKQSRQAIYSTPTGCCVRQFWRSCKPATAFSKASTKPRIWPCSGPSRRRIRCKRDEEWTEELHPHRTVPFCKGGRRLSAEMRPGVRIGIPTGACRRLNEQAMEKKRAGADRGLLIAQIRNLVICGGTCSSAKRRIVRTGPMFGSPVQNRSGIWYNRKEKPIQAPGRRAKWQNEL